MTVYIDGQYLKVSPKTLEAFVPGVFQGDGVFETLLAIGGKVLDAKEHLARLHKAMPKAKVTPAVLQRIAKVNGFPLSRVRIVAWTEKTQVHVAVMALAYKPSKDSYKACIIKTNRTASAKTAHLKSLDYTLFKEAYEEAHAKGFDEAILLNAKGYVFEASRANVFIIDDKGDILTPPLSSGCLNGITRQQLLRQAKKLRLTVKETNITPAMLHTAQEIFLTNSLIGVKPVKIS